MGEIREAYRAMQPIECPIPTRLRFVKSTSTPGYRPLRNRCTLRAYSSQLTRNNGGDE